MITCRLAPDHVLNCYSTWAIHFRWLIWVYWFVDWRGTRLAQLFHPALPNPDLYFHACHDTPFLAPPPGSTLWHGHCVHWQLMSSCHQSGRTSL